MKFLDLFFILVLLDHCMSNASNNPNSNLYNEYLTSSTNPENRKQMEASDKTSYQKICPVFDKLWNQPTYEYEIPSKSFCSDYCLSNSKPYWFSCERDTMPIIEFYFSNNQENCNVITSIGINERIGTDDPDHPFILPKNRDCINEVSTFLHNSTHRSNKLVYITHGFAWGLDEFFNGDWLDELKNGLLHRYKNDNLVVGVLRWQNGAKIFQDDDNNPPRPPNTKSKYWYCCVLPATTVTYGTSSVNTWPIGNILAYVNEKIVTNPIHKPFRTICIGHSLGSQICGFFGKMSKKLKPPQKIDKIIGLDPAGPIFDFNDHSPTLRLDKTDASHVEVYHTNSQTYGYDNPIGDIDFYFNGGNKQRSISAVLTPGLFAFSHIMVVKFFVEINKNPFNCYARWKCNNVNDGSVLKDLRKIDTKEQRNKLSKFCNITFVEAKIGDLNDMTTNKEGVYWVDVYKNSVTCRFKTGPLSQNNDQINKIPSPEGIETIYEFESKNLLGTNGMMVDDDRLAFWQTQAYFTGLHLKANVKIQSFQDHTLRMKMQHIKFYIMHKETSLDTARKMIERYNDQSKVNYGTDHEFLKRLEQPVMVLMKANDFKQLVVSSDEPNYMIFLKKSLIEELKLNGSSRHLQLLRTSSVFSPIMIPSQPRKINFD